MIEQFYDMKPMKYYDCGGKYDSPKAQAMITNANGQYIATQKYDGEWARIIVDADRNVTIQSRSVSKVTGTYGDKTALVPHLIKDLQRLPPCTVLLGELCFNDMSATSRDVGAILRCLPAKAIARQKTNPLTLRVFDVLAWDNANMVNCPYRVRWEHTAVAALTCDSEHITIPDYACCDFEDFLQEILANGGEGIVIHDLDGVYKPGARTAWLTLKVKKITQELELPIVDLIEPQKLYQGTELDSWKYWEEDVPVTKPYWNGWKNGVVVQNGDTEVRVTSGMTDEDREWLSTDEAKELLNNGQLVAVVSAMEVTPDGSLRHPRLIRIRTEA